VNGWPTTRRFARSLAEAFPCERACAIEVHRVSNVHRLAGVLLAIFIGVSVALLLAHYLGA
jgi:hypothetical protein